MATLLLNSVGDNRVKIHDVVHTENLIINRLTGQAFIAEKNGDS